MMKNLSINIDPNYPVIDEIDLGVQYFKKIYKDIHVRRFNYLGMICGKHRTGKSLSAVTMSNILDPTFLDNLENRVVYFASDFMSALQQIKKDELYGAAIVWDEAGVGIPSRDWQDISNKSISMTLQVFGRYLPIVFFVTPDVSYIDSQARKLFHGFYEVSRTNNRYAVIKPFRVSYNKRTGKVYHSYPKIPMFNDDVPGMHITLDTLKIMKPDSEIEKKYDDHSKIFKDKIIDQMQQRTDNFDKGKTDSKRMTIDEIVNTVVSNKNNAKYLGGHSTKKRVVFDLNTIRYDFSISNSMALLVKHRAELEVNKHTE